MARLRAVGALGPAADVVALGRTHELNPGPLERRLALWGARVAPDGGELPAPEPAVAAPWRTLVLGPASSGKSASAEDLLAAEPAVVYAATGPVPVVTTPATPDDEGWAARVAAHRGAPAALVVHRRERAARPSAGAGGDPRCSWTRSAPGWPR